MSNVREYFEKGCLCVINGKVPIAPVNTPEDDVWDYYNDKCECNRGYKLNNDSGRENEN